MFNQFTGFLAVCLFFYWTYILDQGLQVLPDVPNAVLVLASFLALLYGFDEQNNQKRVKNILLFIFSGLLMGLSFWAKEVSISFLHMPILFFVANRKYWKKSNSDKTNYFLRNFFPHRTTLVGMDLC